MSNEMKRFRKMIETDGRYARKIIYGGPKTHDEDGKPIMSMQYVGTTAKMSLQPVPVTEQATAVILVGYCPDTLAYFNAIFDEARKSFPDLKPDQVTCSKVSKSDCVQGFTMILFRVPNKPVKGWSYSNSHIDFNY